MTNTVETRPTSVEVRPTKPSPGPWNSLERAKIAASVLMPIAVCGATLAFNSSANRRAEEAGIVERNLAEAARLEARDVEITKTFAGLIHQEKTCGSFEAVMVLIGHATPQHALTLKEQLERHCASLPDATLAALRARGNRALEFSKAREIDSLVGELSGAERSVARQKLIELFQSDEQMVASRLAAALASNPSYRVALGVLVVLGSTPQGWDRTGAVGAPFERLASSPHMRDATFKEWYERARAAQR
jgi:hypothetical protein